MVFSHDGVDFLYAAMNENQCYNNRIIINISGFDMWNELNKIEFQVDRCVPVFSNNR